MYSASGLISVTGYIQAKGNSAEIYSYAGISTGSITAYNGTSTYYNVTLYPNYNNPSGTGDILTGSIIGKDIAFGRTSPDAKAQAITVTGTIDSYMGSTGISVYSNGNGAFTTTGDVTVNGMGSFGMDSANMPSSVDRR